MMHEFISPDGNIINLATWQDMQTYVTSVIKDNQSFIKFMTISNTTLRVRCMKLRATCIDWCLNFYYCHIVIYICDV
jgi:hypothetical protein